MADGDLQAGLGGQGGQFGLYLRMAGPACYDALSTHAIRWDHPTVVRALTMMNQLFIEGGVVDNASTTGFRSSVAQVFGGEERAATLYGADFVLSIIQSETSADAGKDFDYFGFPSVDTSDPAVVAGGDIAVAFTDRSEAQTLLAFLATKDSAAIWARQGGFVSPNQKVNRRDYRDDMTKEAGESLTQHMTGLAPSVLISLIDSLRRLAQPPATG